MVPLRRWRHELNAPLNYYLLNRNESKINLNQKSSSNLSIYMIYIIYILYSIYIIENKEIHRKVWIYMEIYRHVLNFIQKYANIIGVWVYSQMGLSNIYIIMYLNRWYILYEWIKSKNCQFWERDTRCMYFAKRHLLVAEPNFQCTKVTTHFLNMYFPAFSKLQFFSTNWR